MLPFPKGLPATANKIKIYLLQEYKLILLPGDSQGSMLVKDEHRNYFKIFLSTFSFPSTSYE